MCGRFSFFSTDELEDRFGVYNPLPLLLPRYNISPGQEIPVIIGGRERPYLALASWGLIPSWKENDESGRWLINARSDSLTSRPAFTGPFRQSRCLIPANGFYEWKKEGKRRVPFYVHMPERPIFAFAGLYDQWTNGDGRMTCCIVTTDANRTVAEVHERMPVILSPDDENRWISDTYTEKEYLSMCCPPPDGETDIHAIGPEVNSPDKEGKALIERIDGRKWW